MDTDCSQGDRLVEQVEKQNTRLQVLIERIGQLIAASRALLQRLRSTHNDDPSPPL
jgi:hypothetical protein